MLDYLATHPDATLRYHASDMVLHIHSDASYLSVSNARSRLGGLFFLGNKPPKQDALNWSILNVTAVFKNMNQKLECASTTSKVVPPSESRSPSWVTNNPQRLCERITPLHTAPWTKLSDKNDQRQWTCNTICSQTESAKNNSTFNGAWDVKISQIITQSIIQRNITKICANLYYMKPIVFRFCEGMLN
jgi:hypothetical protein